MQAGKNPARAIVALVFAATLSAGTSVAIDYPEDASIFPPEITAPTFLWHDSARGATLWRIEVSFADGARPLRAISRGPRLRTGPIDPECVAETNELPKLTPRQAESHTWKPAAPLWEYVKKHSVAGPATVTVTGYRGIGSRAALSSGRVTIRTSPDRVDAPIFYRDVPLMPTETEKGSIQPLAAQAVRLIKWRVRNLAEPSSRVVMENLPTCANCHSFSADGKTMGMDLDGLENNKGMYFLAPVKGGVNVQNENVLQWRTETGRIKGKTRIGFMSQVSPDGRHVVTTVDPAAMSLAWNAPDPPSNYYVENFKDYRFLQVFYPTRGVIAWYSKETGVLRPLPGADDPRFVQMGAVWSPDGSYLVFARAGAQDPNPPGAPAAAYSGDPNERQIRYDLYRVPFNGGRGGKPEPIAGASANGMSNSFPKISPDGRWIVFVQSRNGLLMRPDSKLYIVPATGGVPRPLRANTSRMNSWHSFSPNGRWLVFSSKSRSPYTQLYLTHIAPDGTDSPAILVENTTAANRAANIPEFVNVPPGSFDAITGPALDYYRLADSAAYLQKHGRATEAAARWREAVATKPDDPAARSSLAMALLVAGRRAEAAAEMEKARELRLRQAGAQAELGDLLLRTGRAEEAVSTFKAAVQSQPGSAAAHAGLGRALALTGRPEAALPELRRALEIDSRNAPAASALGLALSELGRTDQAMAQWQAALQWDPNLAEAHLHLADALYARGRAAEALSHWREAIRIEPSGGSALKHAARALATCADPRLRNGREAVALAARAVQLTAGRDAEALDVLADAYRASGRIADADLTAARARAVKRQ